MPPDPRAAPSASAAPKAPPARTLMNVLAEQTADKKLLVLGPGPEKLQDSRYGIGEVGADHVVIKLLGEELLVLPFSSILSVKVDRTQVTIRVR
jgi:hypothetical protein